MAVGSFSRIILLAEKEHNNEFVLSWPPNSPDLNPVGHLWDVLNKQVRSVEDLLLTSQCLKAHRASEV